MLRAIDLLADVCDQNDALWRDALRVEGYAEGLAVVLLSLLDGQAYGDADVDVQLLAGRVLHVEQMAFPLAALLIIKKVRASNGRFYGLYVINVDAGLEEECLWVHVGLAAMVAVEAIVV